MSIPETSIDEQTATEGAINPLTGKIDTKTQKTEEKEKKNNFFAQYGEMGAIIQILFTFFQQFFGKDGAKLFDDPAVGKFATAVGLDEKDLKSTISNVMEGKEGFGSAFKRTVSHIDPNNVDIKGARSAIQALPDGDVYLKFVEDLKLDEGRDLTVYPDGFNKETGAQLWSVGYGHQLVPGDGINPGDTITQERALDLLHKDATERFNAGQKQALQVGGFGVADKHITLGLAKVNYQLGMGWEKKFYESWPAIKDGRFEEAIGNIRESDWHGQTKNRAEDFIETLEYAIEIRDGKRDIAPLDGDMRRIAVAEAEAPKNTGDLRVVPPFGEETILTSAFGPRSIGMHRGADFKTKHLGGEAGHAEIDAQQEMVFLKSRLSGSMTSGYGNQVATLLGYDSANRPITLAFNHLKELPTHLKPGDIIKPGDYIATAGSTGRTFPPHLDFEVRIGDQVVNPIKAMKMDLSNAANGDTLIADAKKVLGSKAHSATFDNHFASTLKTPAVIAAVQQINDQRNQQLIADANSGTTIPEGKEQSERQALFNNGGQEEKVALAQETDRPINNFGGDGIQDTTAADQLAALVKQNSMTSTIDGNQMSMGSIATA